MENQQLAEDYLWALSRALARELKDSGAVKEKVARFESHAKGFPEVRFCKGCVLPVVDRVTTQFFKERLGLSKNEAHAALRCEGHSTLPAIYTPSEDQSGFSSYPWGTNHKAASKAGKGAPALPCPDFGIVHLGPPSLTILGEVKYVPKPASRAQLLSGIQKDMDAYMAVERDPSLNWHYEFGIGIAYSPSTNAPLEIEVLTEHWSTKRYFLLLFHAAQARG